MCVVLTAEKARRDSYLEVLRLIIEGAAEYDGDTVFLYEQTGEVCGGLGPEARTQWFEVR